MTLRSRLFLLSASMVILLVLAGAWGVRSLTSELSLELGRVAETVGESVMNFFFTTETGEEGSRSMTFREGSGDTVRISTTDDEGEKGMAISMSDDGSMLTVSNEMSEGSIPVPDEGVQAAVSRFERRVVFGALALALMGLVGSALVAHRVTLPLRKLSDAAAKVGQGELGARVDIVASGEIATAIAAFNEMSDRLVELEGHNRRLQAREHLGELGEVARGLAHSLRNPLNTLGLSIEEIARSKSEDRSMQLAGEARDQIRRVDRTLRSFLALAVDGAEGMQVDLGRIVKDVAFEAMQLGQGRVELEVPENPILMHGIEPEIKAAVQVLVENAMEASPAHGVVEIRVGECESRRKIEVLDRGPGLPAQVRDQLFTPHLTTKADGAGMGLFLAHRIASTRYDGALELTPREGGGTHAQLVLGDRVGNHV